MALTADTPSMTWDTSMAAREQRFWNKVDLSPKGCWLWRAHTVGLGYGQATGAGIEVVAGENRHQHLAHRAAWVLVNGPVPEGLQVLHTCDNPPCCRPSHLFLGTHIVNHRDKARKLRAPHKLSNDQVREIRRRYVPGKNRFDLGNAQALAKEFGVTSHHVSELFRLARRKEVP